MAKKNALDADFSKEAKESHSKITEKATEVEQPKVKSKKIPFSLTIPEHIYEKLDNEAERLGTTKKSVIMEGLRHRLNLG